MKRLVFVLLFSTTLLPRVCTSQEVIDGVIDLSKVDLNNNAVAISGDWEFYWNKLINPDSINLQQKDFYRFPKLWNDGVTRNGIELSAQGYGTYRIRIILPPKTPQLAISLGESYNSYRLFYDGFEIGKNGKVGKSKETSIPDWMPQVIPIARYQNTLDLILQVSNYRHSKGGVREPIMIGDRKVLNAKRDFDFSYDFLLSGSLIMGGLFFLGLFMFGQHERSVLFFALFCLTFSYRMIGSGEYAIHALYPNMSWDLIIRVEYLSLFIPCGIFTVYSYLLYPEDSKRWILLGFTIISGVFSILSLFAPTIFFTRLVEPFFVLVITAIFYLIYVYWIAYKRNRTGAQYAFASTGIVFMVAVYLISVYLTPVQENTFLTFIGFILFFFFQSLILSYRFAHSLKKAKDAAEDASKAKTDFLSTISHEIRTPLNAVVGISHFLINENPRKDQKESLESLQFSAEHLTALINDILDYNKLESGSIEFEFTEVNLESLAAKIIKAHTALAKEKGLSLLLELDEKMHPLVLADQTRIYQVLNNLINNALKFTSKGYVKLKTIVLNADEKIQTLRIEVLDSGIGIPYEKQKVIFERFTQAGSSTTREYGGTGLGLAIIRKILNMVGSEIYVKSEPDSGTIFWFDLSFKKVLHAEIDEAVQEEEDSNIITGKRILLVEDNQMNIMVAEKFLKKWELNVEVAHNGQEAVEMMMEKSYDLILMDLQMPIMDGYKATRKIRTFNQKTPIIALTASALLKVRQEVIAAGMNDYITKPFDPNELRRKIASFIKYQETTP
ncbi:Signal transduction histidine kinase [Ekhidna lutea]|uniref:histidine kinase n=1 Tax=Ekhidna lutea TaxID=447679 RepID=A0A239IT14_EKHLU|nr:response regulator [Ekhidna lutea]SNS96173.1 Signal transduction histidine kinase [Ekhidna lutea]